MKFPAGKGESRRQARRNSGGELCNHLISLETLQRRYERELRTCDEWDSTDILQIYLDSLARAYDPHSDYLNYQHAQDFSITMSLALFGIGAELTSEDGYCKISSLVPGGPAAKSKEIKPDDKIVAVAQGKGAPVDVVDMELGKIVQLIRGPKGTEVRLTIIPADDPKSRRVIKLVRDEINLKDEQAKAILIEKPRRQRQPPTGCEIIDVPIIVKLGGKINGQKRRNRAILVSKRRQSPHC